MKWRGRRQSDNIEDRRGTTVARGPGMRMPAGTTVRRAGGGGLVTLVVIGLVLWAVAGINPLQLISILGGDGAPVETGWQRAPADRAPAPGADDEMKQFVATVLAETEDTWGRLFAENGGRYGEPTLVLFTGSVRSACGFAGAAAGPFYCPGDSRVYLDLAFFQELARRFGAPGDFAQAYVIAHEVGHHVQNELGILPEANRLRQRLDEVASNRVSVQIELQADCFAGIWAHYADRDGLLDADDVSEALAAARAVGDDTLQRRMQGYVVPETFSHGTSEQRQRWFMTGLRSGDVTDCDTFNARAL